MYHNTRYFFLIICSVLLVGIPATAQPDTKKLRKATDLFNVGSYVEAQALYEQLLGSDPQNPAIHYGLGVCYLRSADPAERQKAISHLESAERGRNAEVPFFVHYHLGRSYHEGYRFEDAIRQLDLFLAETRKNDVLYAPALRYRQHCENALAILPPNDAFVQNLGAPLNTPRSEYAPAISADEQLLIYTGAQAPATEPSAPASASVAREQIYSARQAGGWQPPQPISFREGTKNFGSVSLSPDGRQLLLYAGNGQNDGNLFRAEWRDGQWTGPLELEPKVNSRYVETAACFAADGQAVYFASNRPGGHGGYDLYVMEKGRDGKWSTARNLGPNVNTPGNEGAPFIHPDQRTLFFHSDGHNSMGGLDIFRAARRGDKWLPAQNLGAPINTPYDDGFFVLTPDGSKGYFSSNRIGGQGGMDLYLAGIPLEMNLIPLTMLKGRVLGRDADSQQPPTPVKAFMQVFDHQTGQPVAGVYHPDARTGQYLIIFPPGKDYDMVIEAEGYRPHTVRIRVPNQTYFHEIYQQITLEPIRQFEETVGQKVTVENAFYDTGQDELGHVDPRKAREARLVRDSLDVFEMMEMVLAAGDSVAYDYLLGLMYDTNPIENVNFNQPPQTEALAAEYYHEEPLVEVQLGGQVFYTVPSLTPQGAEPVVTAPSARSVAAAELKKVVKVYFDVNRSALKPQYHAELNKLLAIWQANPELRIEIAGYADASGNREANFRLSNERAKAVLKYFNERGLPRRHIIAKGHGQTAEVAQYADASDQQKDRKVEIRLISEAQYQAVMETR